MEPKRVTETMNETMEPKRVTKTMNPKCELLVP